MSQLLTVVGVAWLAGIAAFLGGIIARYEGTPDTETKQEIIHGVVAFGGGVLVAAVAFVLTPEALSFLSPVTLVTTFCLGGIIFLVIDAWITNHGGSMAQFMAMLLDFVPEAISLGGVFGSSPRLGMLLALFIAAQNIPEGFNSFREIAASGIKKRRALAALIAISLLGPFAASLGYVFLQNQPEVTAGIMNFAAGGILYLVFQDIAPQSRMRWRWTPPLGAVLGFVVGMLGKQLGG